MEIEKGNTRVEAAVKSWLKISFYRHQHTGRRRADLYDNREEEKIVTVA